MKKLILYLLLPILFLPALVFAADVEVTAVVVPNISETLSAVEVNLTELPADGVSTVIITVTVKYKDGTPAIGRDVSINSNRGNVEFFRYYDGSNWVEGTSGKTDSSGIIRFSASSTAPGRATFIAVCDNVVLEDKPSVNFMPLPVLERLLLTVQLPFGQKITLLKPPVLKELPNNRLVDTGIEMEIPFWIFLIIVILLISTPIFFIWILLMIIALRRRDKKEDDLLRRIYELEQQLANSQQAEVVETQKIEKVEEEILDKIEKKE
jgi:hypothetical protein